MKKILSFLLLIVPTSVLFSQNTYDKEPFLTKSLSGASIKDVKVQTSGGSISVTGGGTEHRIEVYVRPNNGKETLSKEEIQKRLDEKYTLDISVANNKLTATAKPKDKMKDWKNALSISFRVFVPQNVSTDLVTSGGSIHLANLSGSQEFATSGGSLHIEKLSGKTRGSTSGGSIQLQDSKDDIELTTSGGSINASNSEGKMKLSTSGGSLSLNGLKGEIKASTSGGSVSGKDIYGDLSAFTSGGNVQLSNLRGSVEAGTSGGNVDVSITEFGQFVKISNSGGNIRLEMPGNKGLDLKLSANRIRTDSFKNFSGKVEDDEIDGKLNGGGIPVSVRAGSGNIQLALK